MSFWADLYVLLLVLAQWVAQLLSLPPPPPNSPWSPSPTLFPKQYCAQPTSSSKSTNYNLPPSVTQTRYPNRPSPCQGKNLTLWATATSDCLSPSLCSLSTLPPAYTHTHTHTHTPPQRCGLLSLSAATVSCSLLDLPPEQIPCWWDTHQAA